MPAANPKTGGMMLIIAGALFLIVALLGVKIVFFSLGVAIILIGAIIYRKAKGSAKDPD